MKIYILLIIFYLIIPFSEIYGQIGIHTEKPAGGALLHIDPQSNSLEGIAGSTLNFNEDVIVTTDGNMVLGASAPAKGVAFDLNEDVYKAGGSVRIDNGSAVSSGYVLTSDKNGVASYQPFVKNKVGQWHLSKTKDQGASFNPYATLDADFASSSAGTNTILPGNTIKGLTAGTNNTTRSTLTIPKGRYMVFVNFDLDGSEYGIFKLKNNKDSSVLFQMQYSEALNAGASILTLSEDTTVYISYRHIVTNVSIYTNNNTLNYGNTGVEAIITFLAL